MMICLAVEAFFSGAEIGVVSADRMKLRQAASRGGRGARLALDMLGKPEWLLSTTLVGTNIAVVANTTLATALVIEVLGEQYSWVAVVGIAPVIWIFGEIVPKSLFQQHADEITPRAIHVLRAASLVFAPILFVFAGLARAIAGIFGGGDRQNPFTLREELAIMMDMSSTHGDILPVEKDMIRRVFDFSETTAREIMVPLIDVAAVSRDANCGEAVALAVETAHKRLPVFDGRVDNIVGVLNVLDLLAVGPDLAIAGYIRPVRFSPAVKSIGDLLVAMRRDGGQTTVVVDEYGGAEGIVMLEDVLEEVVGELEDEYDHAGGEPALLRRLGEGEVLAGGRCDLADVADAIGTRFPGEGSGTVAGFVLGIAREIPEVGETVIWHDLSFTVTAGSSRVIREVRIRREPVAAGDDGEGGGAG